MRVSLPFPAVPPAPAAPAAVGAPATGALSSTNLAKRTELLAEIRKEHLVVVTGTGVTLQSVGHPDAGTEVAGWPGLLADGLDRCRRLRLIDDDDAEIVSLQI